MSELPKSRELLIARAKKQLAEIEQYFLDIEHYNRTHPNDQFEADPERKLALTREQAQEVLRRLEGRP